MDIACKNVMCNYVEDGRCSKSDKTYVVTKDDVLISCDVYKSTKRGGSPHVTGTYTNMNSLEVGTKFYCTYGCWDGEIVEENGVKCVYVCASSEVLPAEENKFLFIDIIE